MRCGSSLAEEGGEPVGGRDEARWQIPDPHRVDLRRRREFCNFAGTPSSSLLVRLRNGERGGGGSRMTVSSTAGRPAASPPSRGRQPPTPCPAPPPPPSRGGPWLAARSHQRRSRASDLLVQGKAQRCSSAGTTPGTGCRPRPPASLSCSRRRELLI